MRALTSSWSLIPATIHRETESGSLEDIPAHTLRAEMLVHVKPGERIPCDGIIETGDSSLDCSAITGELLPVAVQATSAVLAGSLNLEVPLRIRAATNAGASQLDRILARVAASSSAAPSTFTTSFDTLSMIFTASALLLAGGAFFVNASTSWDAATSAAIAMLTVTCPCAVALALPLLSIRALGACARRGILVASAQVFENLPKVTSAFFDKTGTLTQGHLEVSKVHFRGSYTPDQLVEPVNHLSQVNSSHPISQALARWAQKHRDGDATSTLSVTTMQAIPSKGVRLTFVDAKEAAKTPRVASLSSLTYYTEHRQSNDGMPIFSPASSVSVLEIDSKPVAFLELQDTIHPLAHRLLSHFGSRTTIGILSGDRPEAVYSVAHQFPATPSLYRGDLSPDGKAELIQATQGTSLFVGDGANDAPALLAATVGVALRGGIQSLLECADTYITRGGIEQVITLDKVALNYRRISRTIITLGLAYNCAGICAAMLGYITPLVAAIAMPIFSTIVVSIAYAAGARMKWGSPLCQNSLRLRQARYKSSRLSQTSPGAY